MIRSHSAALFCLAASTSCAATAKNSPPGRVDDDIALSAPAPAGNSTTARPENTPALAPGAPFLGRAEFVKAVLARNPNIESARQAWRAALARVEQTDTFEDPMVELGMAPLTIGSSHASFGYVVGISQKLPWFGKRSLEATAAAAEAEATKSDFEAMRRELALAAIGLYGQYFVAVRSIEINGHHTELMRVIRGSATAQFEAGRGSAQDPLQAEGELARMERDTAMLSAQLDTVTAQMNELLHRDPGEPLPPPPNELPLPPAPGARDPKHLGEEAVSGRPDIAAMRHRARAAQSRAERVGRESYPDVMVGTSYNSMWEMPEHRWMVEVGFNLPIWSGARGAAGDEEAAMRAQFESDARRLEASARTQVFVTLKQLEESRHVLRLFEERLLPVARAQIEAARAGFTTSRNPFMAVVEAERNLRSVELDYQMARAECDRRHAELERAIGRIPGISEEGAGR